MFPKISPRNNEWNRGYGFSEENGQGFLMDRRNGLAFFGWMLPGEEPRYFKCEEGVFNKSFDVIEGETVTFEFDPYDNLHFLRYPLDK